MIVKVIAMDFEKRAVLFRSRYGVHKLKTDPRVLLHALYNNLRVDVEREGKRTRITVGSDGPDIIWVDSELTSYGDK